MATYANVTCTTQQIRATVRLLRYYRAFLDSGETLCRDIEGGYGTMSHHQVKRRLPFLLHVAINRRAGIPDVACRKQESDYQVGLYRDSWRLRDIARRVRVYQFESQEVRRRCAHLLSSYDD
jgi:hypothetical protein